MTLIEYVGYLLLVAYLIVFFGLTVAAARRAKRSVWLFGAATPGQRLPATLFQLGFIGRPQGWAFVLRAHVHGLGVHAVYSLGRWSMTRLALPTSVRSMEPGWPT